MNLQYFMYIQIYGIILYDCVCVMIIIICFIDHLIRIVKQSTRTHA